MKCFAKKNFWFFILLAISIGIFIYFCIADDNLSVLFENISTTNVFWLILASVSIFLSWFIESYILNLLTKQTYEENTSLKSSLEITMVGQYFNAISPFCIAGQPMQVLVMSKKGMDAGTSISIVVKKFLIYQTTLILYSTLAITLRYSFFDSEIPGFMPFTIIGFCSQIFIILVILFFSMNRDFTVKTILVSCNLLGKTKILKDSDKASKSVIKQLDLYVDSIKSMRNNLFLIFKLYILTFLQFSALFVITFFIYKAFNNDGANFFTLLFGQAFVTITSSATPLPGGSGASEGTFLIIFNSFFDPNSLRSAMIIWRFITYYYGIIIGSIVAVLAFKGSKGSVKAAEALS